MKVLFILAAVAGLLLLSTYNNCSPTVGRTNIGSNMDDGLVWRPNVLASFSCSSNFPVSSNISFDGSAYPSFRAMYLPETDSPQDSYPAGLGFSIDGLAFVRGAGLNPTNVAKIIPELYPELMVIADAADPTPSGGWSIISPDPSYASWDTTIHTSSGSVNTTIASQHPASFNPVSLVFFNQISTVVSLGLFFHSPTEPNFTIPVTYNGGANIEGEALRISYNVRAIDGTQPITPYTAAARPDVLQMSSSGVSHSWACAHYLVAAPGGGGCTPDATNPPEIAALNGVAAHYGSIPCYIPNSGNSCYSGYNPLSPAPTGNTPWYADPIHWAHNEGGAPHWLSLCKRSPLN